MFMFTPPLIIAHMCYEYCLDKFIHHYTTLLFNSLTINTVLYMCKL